MQSLIIFIKSLNNLSFRAKREIFILQYTENIRFLPAVEMTNSLNPTFYEIIKIDGLVKSLKFDKGWLSKKVNIQGVVDWTFYDAIKNFIRGFLEIHVYF